MRGVTPALCTRFACPMSRVPGLCLPNYVPCCGVTRVGRGICRPRALSGMLVTRGSQPSFSFLPGCDQQQHFSLAAAEVAAAEAVRKAALTPPPASRRSQADMCLQSIGQSPGARMVWTQPHGEDPRNPEHGACSLLLP